MSEALKGLRVLEISHRSVVLTGRILADLGAEVILIEPPGGADIRFEQPGINPDHSFAHLYFNTNKKSVVLDLEDDAQHEQFLGLVASADVLLEGEAPGRLDALGLSHAQLRAVNTTLIQCSVTPFGMDTPWKDRKANDLVAGAAGGLIQVSGEPNGTPVQGGANPSYTMSGLAAASAISIALHQRDIEGSASGLHIDLSMQEATALAVMQTASPGLWQWHKRIPRRPGLSAAMACKDGKYVGLLVRPDRFDAYLAWADKVGIDHGMTSDDWHWARLESPRKNNPVAATTLALAAALNRDEFVAGALEADIICLPVLDFPDLEVAEQYQVNDQFLSVHHPGLDETVGLVRSPVDAMADGVEFEAAPDVGVNQELLEEAAPVSPAQQAPAVTHPDPAKALAGLRVVDFGWVLAAPIGTRILASFGAEVIRIESSQKPDSMRSQFGPEGKPDPDMGGLFNTVNAGKKSLSVDLTQPAGLELVKDLIRTADIVVNNFRPDAMERMGLGYEVLKTLKEDIILLNLPGAHRHGPWAQRPSMGNILMAASGFNMLTGFEGERPRGIGIAYPDFTSPHLLVTTLLAAVRQRKATGKGQQLHLTQLTGVLSLLGAEWMQFKATGEQPPRNANRNPNYCPHGVYPTVAETDPETDAWIAFAVKGEDEWAALCELMGSADLAADDRFKTHALRKQHEDELDGLIRAWTSGEEKWALTDRLQAVGIAAAPVEHLKDMLENDPQLPRHYQQVTQPVQPDIQVPVDKEAARWVGHDLVLNRSPMLGEHNEYVVQELLGKSDEEFAELIINEVLT